MRIWIAIAVGGALGALARYGLSGFIQQSTSSSYPWGTLTVNVVGSFLMGALWHYMEFADTSPTLRGLILVGGLGAFTTFSTYSLEVLTLGRMQDIRLAFVYVLASNLLSVIGALLGYICSRPWLQS